MAQMIFLFFITTITSFNTMAQEGAQAPGLANFVPIIAIFFIIYFLMIRPQKKQLEEEKAMLGGGDEIYTKSGILGTIVGMTDKVVTLEVSDNLKLKVLRSQIGGLSSKLFEKKKEEKK